MQGGHRDRQEQGRPREGHQRGRTYPFRPHVVARAQSQTWGGGSQNLDMTLGISARFEFDGLRHQALCMQAMIYLIFVVRALNKDCESRHISEVALQYKLVGWPNAWLDLSRFKTLLFFICFFQFLY